MNGTLSGRRMGTAGALSALGLAGALALTGCGPIPSAPDGASGSVAVDTVGMAAHRPGSTAKQIELYTTMSTLWAQHMEWTYATVIAFAEESPGLAPTLDRLLQNQVDLGDAIRPFYGDEAGDMLTELLTAHIEGAVPVLTAAKAGDGDALAAAVDAWYANAEEIADFLASANPHWTTSDMREMMRSHITQTITYASDALAGDVASAIADYGVAEHHMQEMADMLSAGLIAQFPDRF